VRRDGDRYAAAVGRHVRIGLRLGAPVEPDPLTAFLTDRWGLHTRIAGRLVHLPVSHRPWPLRSAEVTALTGDPLAAAGVPAVPGGPVSVLFSSGVDDVRFGVPDGGDRCG
jgi:uncharacterized protein